jgi:hypothetical protein
VPTKTEIGHTMTGGFPCITLTNPCVLLSRSSHRLSTRPLRRRIGAARSERGDGVVLPIEHGRSLSSWTSIDERMFQQHVAELSLALA